MKQRWFCALAITAALPALFGATIAQAGCQGNAKAKEAKATPAPVPAESPAAAKAGDKGAAPVPAMGARGAEHAVYSLTDNRLVAHVQRGGGEVALPGSAGFAKYLRFAAPKVSWTLRQKVDDKRVAIGDSYASLAMPLTDEQAAKADHVWVRLKAAKPHQMELKLNEKGVANLKLSAGWQTLALPIPAGAAKVGENEFQFVFGKGTDAAVEWIQLGGEAPAGDAAPTWWDGAKSALVLPKGGGLAYYVQVPEKGRLVGDVDGAGCEVTVHAKGQDGAAIDGKLRGAGGAVELGTLAGKIVRLDLGVTGCDEARLVGGALAIPGAAPVVTHAKKPKHVIMWVMDSLRADKIKPFFDGARPDVPNFEKLVGTAAIFVDTYVQGNESRASHSSIWSSTYPVNHKVITETVPLASKWVTVGEAMKGAGFFTSGVSANGFITKAGGFGDGWDVYRNNIHVGGGVRGEDVLGLGEASVEKKKDDPWFLYMGTIDTHVSWRGKQPWFGKYDPEPYEGVFKKEAAGPVIDGMAAKHAQPSARDLKRLVALYDSNVSYQDDLVGKLFDKLAAWGVLEDTMVILTADHGDELWEEGRVGHGGSLREVLVHVPLVIYYPPLFPAGKVIEGAESVDILPTMLDAVGQPPPADAQGESLVPLAQGVGRGYPRPSIASQYEFAHAMRLGEWKVRVGGSGVPTLWHISEDHFEKKDLAAERPIERRFMTDALSTFLVYQKDWKKWKWGVCSNVSPGFAADLGDGS